MPVPSSLTGAAYAAAPDRLTRAVRALSLFCGYVAAALVAFAVVVVCEMVFVRFVLNQSTIWQTDLITYCITAATFIGSPYVLLTRGHVNVNVLPLHLSPRKRYARPSPGSVAASSCDIRRRTASFDSVR